MARLDRDAVLGAIRNEIEELRRMGVLSISLFGSVARGEAGPDSDVDVLVDLAPGVTLFDLVGIQHHLEDLIGVRVDVAPADGLKPQLRDQILSEAIRVA